MTWFFAILIVLAMGGVAVVASGRGAPLAEVYDDRPDAQVPATGRLGARDLRSVRFSLAVRGYRMSEVDALLDRLATEREQADRAETSDAAAAAEAVPRPAYDAPLAPTHPPEPPPDAPGDRNAP